MVGTMAASTAAIAKAGTNVGNPVPNSLWDDWIEEAEDHLSAIVKYDLVANWATASSAIMTEYVARSAAIQGIAWDMSGYTSPIEAENMITVHWARMLEIQELLENEDVQNFIGA